MSQNRPLHLIDQRADLEEFAEKWLPVADGAPIALDIEEDRAKHYLPSVALIQVSFAGHDFILDPILLPRPELDAVVEALCLTPTEVIMHGCRNDVVGLKRDFGVGPDQVRDTQMAARFAAFDAFGLAPLLESQFGRVLDKEARRSDWTCRPLSPKQIQYARADTAHLAPLWENLRDLAIARGWEDALFEECQALADLAPESTDFDPHGWRRVKGVSKLTREGKWRVAALWRWRESIAARVNLHPTRVMPPWAIVLMASRGPSCLDDPSRIRGVPPELLDGEIENLRELLASPPEPERRQRKSGGPRPLRERERDRLDRLLEWRVRVAEETRIDPGFLAPRSLLEGLAALDIVDRDAMSALEGAREWRLRRYADDWATLLA